MGYYWYEAVFLDKEDVENAFHEASDKFPKYEFVPYNFHVTTSFMPEPKHEELYGTPVTVHIIRYAYGSIQDVQDNTASDNEGLLVEISSTDKRMQALIDSIDKTFHITGSYTGEARYTGQLDFSEGTPIDITIKGVFGMSDNDENVTIKQQNGGTGKGGDKIDMGGHVRTLTQVITPFLIDEMENGDKPTGGCCEPTVAMFLIAFLLPVIVLVMRGKWTGGHQIEVLYGLQEL